MEGLGCRCTILDNADAAVESVEEIRPDIVILDIGLPGYLSGLDACKLIRSNFNSALTLIIASWTVDIATLRYAARCGADVFIKKPFRAADFISTFQQVIEQHHQ